MTWTQKRDYETLAEIGGIHLWNLSEITTIWLQIRRKICRKFKKKKFKALSRMYIVFTRQLYSGSNKNL